MIITEKNTGTPVWVAGKIEYKNGFFIAFYKNDYESGSKAFRAEDYGLREGTPEEEEALLKQQVLQQRTRVSYASTLGKLGKEIEQCLEQLHTLQQSLEGMQEHINNQFEIWPNLRKETK